MKRINIIVEGPTEEEFVKKVLRPYFAEREIMIAVQCVYSSVRHGVKGGVSTFQKVQNDVLTWLRQDTGAWVSTMFDLYGLPNTFPGYASASGLPNPYDRVHHLEREWFELTQKNMGSNIKFIPYIQLHEFETLLFSSISHLSDGLTIYQELPKLVPEIEGVLTKFNENPELINDSPQTAPSKRLKAMCSSYSKTLHGPLIAEDIGIATMRLRCRHFHHWLNQLEQLESV